jgi:tetratricopeptide (TPR) repeat protein
MLRPTTTIALTLLAFAVSTTPAHASPCPDVAPAEARERRTLAKEWFGKAEAAESASDWVTASKAYQCSIGMVPHAFTAFNLARVSEKAGDLELALDSYTTYLKLAPEANDRADVQAKMTELRARIAAVKPAMPLAPRPVAAPAAETPSPVTSPPLPVFASPTPASEPARGARFGALGYAMVGTGVAALAGGVLLNMQARSKMDSCRAASDAGRPAEDWQPLCDAAKPRAYASYGLFGLAGAAALGSAVLLLRDAPEGERITLAPLPGGAALVATGRF